MKKSAQVAMLGSELIALSSACTGKVITSILPEKELHLSCGGPLVTLLMDSAGPLLDRMRASGQIYHMQNMSQV